MNKRADREPERSNRPPSDNATSRPRSSHGGQWFGRIIDRQPSGSGPGGRLGTYFVRDDETGDTYSFSYADIVTEGFRTIRTGERVRYLTDPVNPDHASYVIRLDLPDVEEFYR